MYGDVCVCIGGLTELVRMTLLQWFAFPDLLPWDQEHKISDQSSEKVIIIQFTIFREKLLKCTQKHIYKYNMYTTIKNSI